MSNSTCLRIDVMETSDSQTIKYKEGCLETAKLLSDRNLLFWGDVIENNFLCKTKKPQLRNKNKGLQNHKIPSTLSKTQRLTKNQSLEQADTDPDS